MRDRLQFVHHDEVFATRESAIQYVKDLQMNSRASLFAEPIVLKYESGDAAKGPNVILAIGSHGIGEYTDEYKRTDNRTFFIDIAESEEAIDDIYERIDEIIRMFTLIPLESDTLKAFANTTDDGTIISGDVKVADNKIINGIQRDNTIQITENGVFHYVSLSYDDNTGNLKFTVNENEDTFSIPTVKSGEYVYSGADAETIILTLSDDSKVKIPVGKLVNEWTVVPEDANTTPIVLKREEVDSEHLPHGVEEWQDVLTADIRLHEGDGNIIYKSDDGRTVFASVSLDYVNAENKLVFKWSQDGEIKQKEIELNSVQVIEYIRYDSTTEEIIIGYKTSPASQIIEVRIPVGELIAEWQPVETGHNVILKRDRSTSGTDVVYADVRIDTALQNNIIETIGDNKGLYVRGEADNIKFGNTNVDAELVRLNGEDVRIEGKLDAETNRAQSAETLINNIIGTGFTDDSHDNVTYHVQQLEDKTEQLEDDLENETERAELAEGTLQANINAEKTRAEAAEAALQADIDSEEGRAISAEGALSDRITAEVTRSTNKDNEISTIIGSGFTTDNHETITYKFNELSARSESTDAAIAAEKARAEAAEAALQADIDSEEGRAISAEGVLDGKITDEKNRATSAETTLQSNIDAEKTRAQNAESSLNTAINNEVQARTADVDAEENRAKAAETVLTNTIGTGFTDDPHENVSYKFTDLTNKINTVSGKADTNAANIATNRADINTLSVQVATISGDSANSVKSVTAIANSGITVNNTDRNNPKVGVQLSPDQSNIMVYTANGIKAEVSMSYNSAQNQLTLTTSNGGQTDIQLVGISVFDSFRYDPATESIIITYHSEGESHTMSIPVGDLIREWEPDNNNHTVNITRVTALTGTDKVSADVKLVSSTDQMIQNVSGALIVSRAPITALENALAAETTARENADSTLDGKITTEKNRAESAETALNTAISNEATARQNADTTLDGKITTEKNRATSAETALQTAINNEATARQNADTALNDAIDAEETRATNAERDLHDEVVAEERRASGAEHDLHDEIVAEQTRAEGAESTLQTNINSEATTRQNADTALNNAITAETSARQSADSTLTTAINNEASARTSADTALQTAINNEATARQNADTALDGKIDTETSNRQSADSVLDGKITAEKDRAMVKESELQTAINNEVTNRISAVNNEASLRTATDNALSGAISTEVVARASGDTVNSNAINNEVSARTTADRTLDDKITAEFNRASSAETKNASDITDERLRAINAEDGLTTDIANVKAALSAETTNREAADTIINNRIDALEGGTSGYVTSITENNSGIAIVDGTSSSPRIGVALDPSTENILTLTNGLSVKVSLTYDSGENKLTFNDGKHDPYGIQLSSVSIIDSIVYDSQNKRIVIKYKSGTQGIEQTVYVDVEDMVKEWEVDNTGHTVTLTRTSASGQTDKLSADVNISNDNHNMLTNQNGYLFVSNESIIAVSGAVTAETAARIAQDATLNNAITAETAARTAQDTALNTKIDAEKTRAEGVEATLTSSINTVASNLSTETANRTAEDSAMNTRIDAVADDCRYQGTALTAEIARAKAAESALTNSVDGLTTTTAGLTTSVNTLRTDVNTISGSVNTLNGTVTTQSSTINTLRTDVNTVSGNVGTVSGTVTTLSNNVNTLRTDVNTVSGNVGTVSGTVNTLRTDVNTLSNNVTAMGTNVGTISGKVGTLEDKVNSISADVRTMSGNIADLNDKANWVAKNTTTVRLTKNTSTNPNEVSADVNISSVPEGNMLTSDANGLVVSKLPINNIISAVGRMDVNAQFSGFASGRFIQGKTISEAIQALNDALEEIYQLYEARDD